MPTADLPLLKFIQGVPESNLIVNIIFEGSSHDYSKLPSKYHGSKVGVRLCVILRFTKISFPPSLLAIMTAFDHNSQRYTHGVSVFYERSGAGGLEVKTVCVSKSKTYLSLL